MALANKYRPKSFTEVIGQDNAVVALRNIIKNQNFHNGYIFSGTRGVGKTTLGRLFAKALNCSNHDLEKGETCNVCANCEAIQNNSHLDLIEIDAASRTGVDDMRELLDSVQYRPSQGKYKVYLIDEVHMLSMQSFNALLKTLEEPPSHVIFIMATTETHKIPKTIISRCLQFNLKLVSDELIKENIKKVFKEENVNSDEKSLDLLVELAKGSVRDSLTLSDQAISHCDSNLEEESISKLHGVLDLSSTTKLFDSIFSNEADKVVEELKRYQSLDVNYEILFDRALSFLHQKIMQMALTNDSSAQSLNLYYQFFSNGLVDAKQTGKTRDCFDIAVLRCLTFTDSNRKELKKKSKLVEKIEPNLIKILGRMDPQESRFGISVTPYVGYAAGSLNFKKDPKEVETIFSVPLNYLKEDPLISNKITNASGETFETPVINYENQKIWGLTLGFTLQFLELMEIDIDIDDLYFRSA